MSQQQRRSQEGRVVRRLTVGAGATALGLAGYFTVSAATAVPITVAGLDDALRQPAAQAVPDDHVFVRRVHVPALQPPPGGVRPGTAAQPATAPPVAGAQAAPPPTAKSAPPPPPVATTGGTKPR